MPSGSVQSLGLSYHFFRPRIIYTPGESSAYYIPRGQRIDGDWSRLISSHSHTIDVFGWYKSLSLSITGNDDMIDWWIENALGMHVEVYAPSTARIFEGFVDQYSAATSTVSSKGGPLMDVVNRNSVTYNKLDPSTSPPSSGPATQTTIDDVEISIERYGILEDIYSGGSCLEDEADYIRDSILQDRSDPERTEDVVTGSISPPSITLTILGYHAWLDKWIYNSPINYYGYTTPGAKLAFIGYFDPNAIFGAETSRIEDPLFLLADEERGNRKALSIIKAIVARGGGTPSYERWMFGLRNDRTPYYNAIPTHPEYQHRITDPSQRISTYGVGKMVYPWEVVPGKWLFTPDFIPGRQIGGREYNYDFTTYGYYGMRDDPRFMFIESMTFTAPWQVKLTGKRAGRVDQILAEYNNSGGMS